MVGREFEFRLLSALIDDVTETSLLALVDEALEAHVNQELPEGRERFQFSHSLIQETVSEELSTSRKVRLHARIAEGLEEIYEANVEAGWQREQIESSVWRLDYIAEKIRGKVAFSLHCFLSGEAGREVGRVPHQNGRSRRCI